MNDKGSISRSTVKGALIAFAVFLMISTSYSPMTRAELSNTWAIGVWFDNYSGSGTTDWGILVDVAGFPTASSTITMVVFTSSMPSYLEQSVIDLNYSNYDVYDYLYNYMTAAVEINLSHSVSSISGWNTIEQQLVTQEVCDGRICDNDQTLNFKLSGTTYDNYVVYTCSYPCTTLSFSNYLVPNGVVESYDGTAGDFLSMDVHGYFGPISSGTVTKQSYMDLFGGEWAYGSSYGNICSPPSPQTGNYGVGGGTKGPNTVGVTGYYWTGSHGSSRYGSADEWGIGDYMHIDGKGVYDPVTDSNMSSYCNTQMS